MGHPHPGEDATVPGRGAAAPLEGIAAASEGAAAASEGAAVSVKGAEVAPDEPEPGAGGPVSADAEAAPQEPAQAVARGRRPRWPGPARALTLVLLAALGFGGVVAARSADPSFGRATADPDRLAASLAAVGARDRSLAAREGRLRQAGTGAAPPATGVTPPATGAPPSAPGGAVRSEAAQLAVLAGTVPVSGPGVELTIRDPHRSVDASVLVDALQELRDAGAEAIEIAGVRAVVTTYVADDPGRGLIVDGTSVSPPYALRVVGDAHTLDQALRIPGGVLDTVAARDGAQASVRTFGKLEIRSLRPTPSPRYARPAG
ncbi:DUF881 domain-containing protein [Frankia sp. AgB32]|uniref:DUF881 domain-containing protein n=1 Tax=Frankia sp. AgB32 TaxID=631119 RepID=UPI002010949F|nr:DUF881 domain-containing protein [Frankia sp. AgB32]MCK9893919.1 DUF881 domain-containing protein [Frankia sp. AgB32]